MQEIRLTQGKTTIVDDEDFEQLNRFKWCFHNGYAVRNVKNIHGKYATVYMHREILNAPENLHCDHINGDRLYNLRINLRLCTQQQNNLNLTKPRRHNKLGIKGVRFLENRNKFSARIRVNKKQIHLGCFSSMRSAEEAYREAELKHYGKFARFNS